MINRVSNPGHAFLFAIEKTNSIKQTEIDKKAIEDLIRERDLINKNLIKVITHYDSLITHNDSLTTYIGGWTNSKTIELG